MDGAGKAFSGRSVNWQIIGSEKHKGHWLAIAGSAAANAVHICRNVSSPSFYRRVPWNGPIILKLSGRYAMHFAVGPIAR
jgi:hypothetical protein